MTRFLNDLVVNWNDQPEHIRSLNWYFAPVLNPDGYEYSHETDRFWSKNRNKSHSKDWPGVDLNNNYNNLGKNQSGEPGSEFYAGPKKFSESETMAHKQFFHSTLDEFRAFLSFHSGAKSILFPWSYHP